jgi:predicted phosphodiesterase
MKIKVISDLHLEFGAMNPGEGDVLILAGDVCIARDIDKKEVGKPYRDFFTKCALYYNKVFYVMGNHEHYGYNFTRTYNKLKDHLPRSITLLENETVFYNNWAFMGATMWTDFHMGNPIDMLEAQMSMSDYAIIRYGGNYRKLLPNDTYNTHQLTKMWLSNELKELAPNVNVCVISHHGPSALSTNPKWRGDGLNSAYTSNLEYFMETYPNIRLWCHGHTHDSHDYIINETRVICNPRGYVGMEPNPTFDPDFEIDSDSISLHNLVAA